MPLLYIPIITACNGNWWFHNHRLRNKWRDVFLSNRCRQQGVGRFALCFRLSRQSSCQKINVITAL